MQESHGFKINYKTDFHVNILQNPEYADAWEKIGQKLSILFRSAANNCFKKNQINESQRNLYFVSVTEKEIINGVLEVNNASDNAIVFFREIENIETDENVIKNKPNLVSRFIEVNEELKVDVDCKKYLDSLKYEKIVKALPETNIHKLKVNQTIFFTSQLNF